MPNSYSLIASLHQRSHDSAVVREFREKTLQRHSDYIREAVSQCQVPKAERERVIEALGYTLEGLVTRRASKTETERTVAFLVEKLTVG
jgi:hypothetical protein